MPIINYELEIIEGVEDKIINFFITSIILYLVFIQLNSGINVKSIHILILAFAIGSVHLFDLVNIFSTALVTSAGALLAKVVSIFATGILWQYGAILGLFFVLTCHLYQVISRSQTIKSKIFIIWLAISINLFLFISVYLIQPYI